MIDEKIILSKILLYYNNYKTTINSNLSFSDAMQIHCEFINNIINLLESKEIQELFTNKGSKNE